MTIQPAHRLLRERTQHLHDEAEAAFAAFDLRRRGDYTQFLLAQAEALVPLEAWMDRHAGAALPDWPARRRASLLRADLAALGAATPIARCRALAIDGDPLGVAYVLEGARLGARLLVRRVAVDGDAEIGEAMRFLGQPRDAAAWSALLARLEAAGGRPGGHAALLAGAEAAFALFGAAARAAARERACSLGALEPNEIAAGRLA